MISPLLSNLYLHKVLDGWFEDTVNPRLRGHAFMVRFAGGPLLAFDREENARRVLEVLAKRLARFDLILHPEKTRLADFCCPPWRRSQRGRRLDLLGFTHYLETLSEWKQGGATQDGQNPLSPRGAADRAIVP